MREYEEGDKVRISTHKKTFNKGSGPTFGKEIHPVMGVESNRVRVNHKLYAIERLQKIHAMDIAPKRINAVLAEVQRQRREFHRTRGSNKTQLKKLTTFRRPNIVVEEGEKRGRGNANYKQSKTNKKRNIITEEEHAQAVALDPHFDRFYDKTGLRGTWVLRDVGKAKLKHPKKQAPVVVSVGGEGTDFPKELLELYEPHFAGASSAK